jgi:hypothetical protein
LDQKLKILILALPILAFACAGSDSSSQEKGASKADQKLISGRSTGVFSPFGDAAADTAQATYTNGEDSEILLWKSRITVFDGTYDSDATLDLRRVTGGISQTDDFRLVSPTLRFSSMKATGEFIQRTDLYNSMIVETIVDRFIEAKETIALIILNFGEENESRHAIRPEYLTIAQREDFSYMVAFEIRDQDFVFGIAASKNGRVPVGYGELITPPGDNSELETSLLGASDVASEVLLSWTAIGGTATVFAWEFAKSGASTVAKCALGQSVISSKITDVPVLTPTYKLTKNYLLSGLPQGETIEIRLCSSNEREGPDISTGITVNYDVPKRAKAVLTGAPVVTSNLSELDITVGGENITAYKYSLLPLEESDCDTATYQEEYIEISTKITDELGDDGTYTLCALGKIADVNLQLVGEPTIYTWTKDTVAPGAFSITSVPNPATTDKPEFSWGASAQALNYNLTIANDASCSDIALSETAYATTKTITTALADGSYFLCVKAVDAAGNTTDATNDGQSFDVST